MTDSSKTAEQVILEALVFTDDSSKAWAKNVVKQLADAGLLRTPGEPTDEQVEAALDAWVGGGFCEKYPASVKHWWPHMHDALKAAGELSGKTGQLRSESAIVQAYLDSFRPVLDAGELTGVITKARWKVTGKYIDALAVEAEPSERIAEAVMESLRSANCNPEIDEEKLEYVIYTAFPYTVESSEINEEARERYITNRSAKEISRDLAQVVAAWLKDGAK